MPTVMPAQSHFGELFFFSSLIAIDHCRTAKPRPDQRWAERQSEAGLKGKRWFKASWGADPPTTALPGLPMACLPLWPSLSSFRRPEGTLRLRRALMFPQSVAAFPPVERGLFAPRTPRPSRTGLQLLNQAVQAGISLPPPHIKGLSSGLCSADLSAASLLLEIKLFSKQNLSSWSGAC